jgi:hypothetical protein
LSRIAKEGRKYGISLGVISQRPSELAATILSQCNTMFAFRMTNERDQEITSYFPAQKYHVDIADAGGRGGDKTAGPY